MGEKKIGGGGAREGQERRVSFEREGKKKTRESSLFSESKRGLLACLGNDPMAHLARIERLIDERLLVAPFGRRTEGTGSERKEQWKLD